MLNEVLATARRVAIRLGSYSKPFRSKCETGNCLAARLLEYGHEAEHWLDDVKVV